MKTIGIKTTFANDHITREAGEKLRLEIISILTGTKRIRVDFSQMVIASTSFFDEGFAKLALEGWDNTQFQEQIEIVGMTPQDQEVLLNVCAYRGLDQIQGALENASTG